MALQDQQAEPSMEEILASIRRIISEEEQTPNAAPVLDLTQTDIVIPPPNVTGSLHMGHALNNTLAGHPGRFERMRGKRRAVAAGHRPCRHRHADGGRAPAWSGRARPPRDGPREIPRKVWEWKAESGGTIVNQLKRLGASCDWSRERFTMDEGLSRAVLKVFVELYKQGLIYKDKRLVNWDPKLLTAISDLEVEQIEVKGNLWHIKYPLEGMAVRSGGDLIVVATTRPETMLGDTAVAVHPEDERYKASGRQARALPLVGRRSRSSPTNIPIPRKAPAR
jgi:valyl-tRNA synthetase